MKVIIRLYGGLGNQLFQYAAGLNYAKLNNAKLLLDIDSGFIFDKKYKRRFNLGYFNINYNIDKSSIILKLMRIFFFKKICHKLLKSKFIFSKDSNYFKCEKIDKKYNRIYLDGHFINKDVINNTLDVLKENIVINKSYNLQINSSIINYDDVIAIHIRWFGNDLLFVEKDIGKYYYKNSILYFINKFKKVSFHFYTDDINKTSLFIKNLNLEIDHSIMSNGNTSDEVAAIELVDLIQYKYKIIGVSTFSWWAAALTKHDDSIIICPPNFPESNKHWSLKYLKLNNWKIGSISNYENV